MLWLSEILLQRHDLGSFDELVRAVQERARGGEMFFSMDVKPSFQDTPEDWEDRLESAFSTALRE
ncbi:MAG TPA: sulfur relay protein DsrC [Chromatiales bacterium]|nr:sulfur relay protein DsrC [Chromatiales bacterium]